MGQPTTTPAEVPRVFHEMGNEYAIRRDLILDEHKPAEAARYIEALTHLHAQLQPGEMVYVLQNGAGRHKRYEEPPLILNHGIYAVREPGLIPGEGERRLAVEGQFEGVVIRDSYEWREDEPHWSVKSFSGSVLLHAGHGQIIEDFEDTQQFGENPFQPQFVIGKAAVERAIKEHPTDSPAFNLQLAIAATRHGIEIPLEDMRVTPDMQERLKVNLIYLMGKHVTGAEVVEKETNWEPTPTLEDHRKEGKPDEILTTNVIGRPPELIRPLAVILGLTPEEVKTGLKTRIDNLEAAIMNGEEKASEYPRVQVGRLRLDRYVDTVFED
jgi:hypothetical protein